MSDREKFIAFMTILTREVRRFLRIWAQTLVPPAITIALYYVIFGSLIGKRIGQMGGFSYMEFVVPGLIMMSVITNFVFQRRILVLWGEIRSEYRGAAGFPNAELHHPARLCSRRSDTWFDGRADRDFAVAILC